MCTLYKLGSRRFWMHFKRKNQDTQPKTYVNLTLWLKQCGDEKQNLVYPFTHESVSHKTETHFHRDSLAVIAHGFATRTKESMLLQRTSKSREEWLPTRNWVHAAEVGSTHEMIIHRSSADKQWPPLTQSDTQTHNEREPLSQIFLYHVWAARSFAKKKKKPPHMQGVRDD